MNRTMMSMLGALALSTGAQAAGITFYEGENFHGRAFTTAGRVENFRRYGYNDAASSVIVDSGAWEVCEDARYHGRCVVLRGGSYASLQGMGLNNRVSSVRPVDTRRTDYIEAPAPYQGDMYAYRRRPNENVYKARITSVHAVVGPPEQHCWVERRQVVEERRGSSAGGAVAGAIIGGILGHQIGSGRGNDAATVGGAVVGGAIGANAGRGGGEQVYDRDVRRCENVPGGPPDYWDVTYNFRGRDHYVQMSSPPGSTIWVNGDGEPRQ
ncbi:MAG: beta/gamma crystallin-related protein [Steroidobacteraceae bacterium]